MTARLDVLVLYRHEDPSAMHASLREHLHVLDLAHERLNVVYANVIEPVSAPLRRARFDAIVLHTTFLTMRWHNQFAIFLWENRWIAEHPAIKIALPQDEYDRSEILDEWLAAWGVSVVFTNFGEEYRELLYPLCSRRVRFEKCFTGYINDDTAKRAHRFLGLADRRLHVVYRARDLPYSFGSHGQLKREVGEVVAARAVHHGLRSDISMRLEDTITGDAWLEFIGGSRSVVGVESGSSVLDRRGEIHSAVQHMTSASPGLSFAEVSKRLPAGWDGFRFFALGPRHFEAIVCRTAQLLVEGDYEGVLVAGRHYLPLKPDWSNLDEALMQLRDPRELQAVVDCAYEEIYRSGEYGYGRFATQLADAIESARVEGRTTFARRAPIPPGLVEVPQHALERSRRIRRAGERFIDNHTALAAVKRYAGAPGLTVQLERFVTQELGSAPAYQALAAGIVRRELGSHGLPADLIRLAAVARARRGGMATFFVSAARDGDRVSFRTAFRSDIDGSDQALLDAVAEGTVSRVAWDHSRMGDTLELDIGMPLQLPMDGDGQWAFAALNREIARGSAAARSLVAAAIGAIGEAPSRSSIDARAAPAPADSQPPDRMPA